MAEKVQCPNCLEPAEKSGNTIICAACDATYKITKTGAATVAQLGRVEKLEKRVDSLEKLLSPEPADDTEPAVESNDDDEEDILPR